jgi:hypothetical protein
VSGTILQIIEAGGCLFLLMRPLMPVEEGGRGGLRFTVRILTILLLVLDNCFMDASSRAPFVLLG